MKNVLIIILVIITLCCGGCKGTPEHMDNDVYEAGINALNVIDDFLAGVLTAADAKDKLDVLADVIDVLSNRATNTDVESATAGHLSAIIENVSYNLTKHSAWGSTETMNSICEGRDQLADELGQAKKYD